MKTYSFLRNLCCFFALCINGLFTAAISTPAPAGVSTKIEMLSEKIDSLDLLKQDFKRRGQPIIEIEQQQDIIRDTLRSFHHELQTRAMNPSGEVTVKNKIFRFPQKPASLFDWIILVTVIVASFSGLMLIIGISQILRSQRRQKKRITETTKKETIKPVSTTREKPAPAYPANEPQPTNTAPPPINTDTIAIRQLRKRIEKQQSSEPHPVPDIPVLPPIPPNNPLDESPEPDSMEKLILDASQSGLDISTISRKFHVSADHVALILKMTDRQLQSPKVE